MALLDNLQRSLQECTEERDKAFLELFRVRKGLKNVIKSLNEENEELVEEIARLTAKEPKVKLAVVPNPVVEMDYADALGYARGLLSKGKEAVSSRKGVIQLSHDFERMKQDIEFLKEELHEEKHMCRYLRARLTAAYEERDEANAKKDAAVHRERKKTTKVLRELYDANEKNEELQEHSSSLGKQLEEKERELLNVMNELIYARNKLADV